MFLCGSKKWLPWLAMLIFLPAATRAAVPAGPTLHFDYGRGPAMINPVSKFMYFVPLVSPEFITLYTNAGNSQHVRIVSYTKRAKAKTFHAECEFEFIGAGSMQNVFDDTPAIHRHDKELKAGKTVPHQIKYISVEGTGMGTLEIDGVLTNGTPRVTTVQMRFNSHGRSSPVKIDLVDMTLRKGVIQFQNETVARVNTLTFQQQCADPRMEVTLDSVKRKNAPDTVWQNFLGGVKGIAANAFLPPIKVTPEGNQTMMDFGQALAAEETTFTFPYAERLKNTGVLPPQ